MVMIKLSVIYCHYLACSYIQLTSQKQRVFHLELMSSAQALDKVTLKYVGISEVLATSFDKVALQYDRSRPTYSIKIFNNFPASFRNDCKCIVEVGAGTGLFTQLLADYFPSSTRIIATEPLKNMRQILSSKFSKYPNVEVYNGSANKLPVIDNNSVDAIFCAQSFHWFANIEALKEFQRILSPNNSYVAMIWNYEQTDDEFLDKLNVNMNKMTNGFFQKPKGFWDNVYSKMKNELLNPQNLEQNGINSFEGFDGIWMRNTHKMQKDHKGLIDLVLSWSIFASATDETREKVANLIQDTIIDFYGSLNVVISIPYDTHVLMSRFNDHSIQSKL